MAPRDFHTMPDGRRIAFRRCAGAGPAVVFLPGYMSDMTGSKATALAGWARTAGREYLLLDYSGCGESPGDFADGTLARWAEEVVELCQRLVSAPLVLVGSSMGGWLMLLVADVLAERVAAMVGIAAAPDFTQWGYTPSERAQLKSGLTVLRDNPYGPERTPTHAAFWSDGQAHRVLTAPVAFAGPVRLLHGLDDREVPYAISLRLAAAVRSQDVQVTLVKGGDHRLSRESDLALLLRTVASLT